MCLCEHVNVLYNCLLQLDTQPSAPSLSAKFKVVWKVCFMHVTLGVWLSSLSSEAVDVQPPWLKLLSNFSFTYCFNSVHKQQAIDEMSYHYASIYSNASSLYFFLKIQLSHDSQIWKEEKSFIFSCHHRERKKNTSYVSYMMREKSYSMWSDGTLKWIITLARRK